MLRFAGEVHGVASSPRFVVVATRGHVYAFHARDLSNAFGVVSAPAPRDCAALALGPRWLAYAAAEPPARDGAPPVGGDSDGEAGGGGATAGTGGGGGGGGGWGTGLWNVAKDVASGLYQLTDIGVRTLAGSGGAGGVGGLPPRGGGTPAAAAAAAADDARACCGAVIVRDTTTRAIVAHFAAHRGGTAVTALAFSASGALLASAAAAGQTVHVHRIVPRSPPALLYACERGITRAAVVGLAFSTDGRWLATTTARGTTHLFAVAPNGGAVDAAEHAAALCGPGGAPPDVAGGGAGGGTAVPVRARARASGAARIWTRAHPSAQVPAPVYAGEAGAEAGEGGEGAAGAGAAGVPACIAAWQVRGAWQCVCVLGAHRVTAARAAAVRAARGAPAHRGCVCPGAARAARRRSRRQRRRRRRRRRRRVAAHHRGARRAGGRRCRRGRARRRRDGAVGTAAAAPGAVVSAARRAAAAARGRGRRGALPAVLRVAARRPRPRRALARGAAAPAHHQRRGARRRTHDASGRHGRVRPTAATGLARGARRGGGGGSSDGGRAHTRLTRALQYVVPCRSEPVHTTGPPPAGCTGFVPESSVSTGQSFDEARAGRAGARGGAARAHATPPPPRPQIRADWLSHAEIVTRSDAVVPPWASPLRRFLKCARARACAYAFPVCPAAGLFGLTRAPGRRSAACRYDPIALAVPGYDTQPRARASSGGVDGGSRGAPAAQQQQQQGAFDEDWSRTIVLSELFIETRDPLPVSVRRFGPVATTLPVAVPVVGGVAAPGDIDYFGGPAHGATAPPISALAGARARARWRV